MILDLGAEELLYFSGGAALLATGMAVALLRHRSATALAFAAFAAGSGLSGITNALDPGYTLTSLWWTALALSAIGYWSLFLIFPRRLGREDLRDALVAAIGGFLVAIMINGGGTGWTSTGLALVVDLILGVVGSAGMIAVSILLPLRARGLGADRVAEARTLAIVAIGLVCFSVGSFSTLSAVSRSALASVTALAIALYILVPTLLWLRATLGPHSRVGRNVIVASVVLYLASLVAAPEVGWAAGRLLGAMLLGFAVMRGQIEGLELKARFALSRSSVAAAFVVVFFLASEVAQQFFGETFGSAYVGIAAAALLLFALAPLQRVAERMAERAIPLAPPKALDEPPTRAEATYRKAVRLAMHSRRLTREEEGHLHELARDLGLDGARAHAILAEVEAEGGRGGATHSPNAEQR